MATHVQKFLQKISTFTWSNTQDFICLPCDSGTFFKTQ